MASPQWRRGQRSEGHASAKRVRFDLPRVHGQWPGTIRGAEPTAGSSFVVGNYITDKTTLTRLRLHQTHPANDSTPQAAPNLQPNTSFMLRGGSAETMRVSCGSRSTRQARHRSDPLSRAFACGRGRVSAPARFARLIARTRGRHRTHLTCRLNRGRSAPGRRGREAVHGCRFPRTHNSTLSENAILKRNIT